MANYKLPPRQKMINLLYVILIAMLAINISGEVLDGFITANKDMKHNVEGLKEYNEVLEKQLAESKNMELARKTAEMKEKLLKFNELIENLEHEVRLMAKESSFSENLEVDDDLRAVAVVMLEQQNASKLKSEIETFKKECMPLVNNETSRKVIENLLSTDVHQQGKTWEEEHFANLPVIGCAMMMSKIEKDMWIALNEVMRCVTGKIEINDSIQQKKVNENNQETETHLLETFIAELEKRNLLNQKTVEGEEGTEQVFVMTENQAPLFANYENKVNVTVFSKKQNRLQVSMTHGKVRKEGNSYVLIPNGKSRTTTLTVKNGKQTLAQYEYKVLPLPAPAPALVYTAPNGQQREYRHSVPLSCKEIQSISEVKLQMTDGVDTKETIAGFDLMLIKNGNKTVQMAHANSNKLTNEMKKILGNVVKGDKLFFTNITLKGNGTPTRQTVSVNVIPM
ncbi:GldM family protein [Phocaeicola plebeius]|uniref:type IX secretion system motor protein PorM/GldM n=1 Tax=Phocaeicola plebeius TaxID=310297 RepID=UPI0026F23B67|nr:GldM family protein [Phocaeicola plebeius]